MNTAFLFVHGIQGHPRQFQFLIDHLPEGTPYRNILLRGHGADVKAFRSSGREAWLATVRKAVGELLGQCDRLVFVGHSMGCLLGLLTEQAAPGTFSEMLLLCCPFRIRPTYRYLRNNLLASRPAKPTDDPFVQAAREANSVTAAHPAQDLTCVHPYLELLRLVRTVRKNAAAPACPVRFLFSEQDEIVSPRSVRLARERFGVEQEIMPGCGHNWFSEKAKQQIADALNAMQECN